MGEITHEPLPVIRDAAQLEAYLAARATGLPRQALEALHMERDRWLALAGAEAGAAWDHAARLGFALVLLDGIEPDPALVAHLPASVGRRFRATPLILAHGYLAIAIDARADESMVASLTFAVQQPIVPVVATIHARLRASGGVQLDREEDRRLALDMGRTPDDVEKRRASAHEEELLTKWPLLQTIRRMMAIAIEHRASDVHLRPTGNDLELLFRIDGNMVPQRRVIPELASLVVNRIKVFAGMDIADHRKPQDGRGSFKLEDGRRVDLRISVIPTVLGESVVIRLLDTEESLKTIDDIQLSAADRAAVDDQVSRTHGFFLTTGPTGCGKSTTLYAMLQEIRRQPVNVLTVEDPVEYTLAGIRQIEVNQKAGLTFASALRSFLRHDPDVIMVGEIRDRETAIIAVESALTGHLVLSTLHTNTAATTVTRLLELGVEAYLLRAALSGVMAQLLVRLNCEACAGPEDPPPHVRAELGVGPDETFTTGHGCARCHGTGVFKRRAVYELMEITPAIRELIKPGVDADRIHRQALAGGMVPLTQAAVAMARAGLISLAEAYRTRAD